MPVLARMRQAFAGMPFKWDAALPAGPIVVERSGGVALGTAASRVLRLLHRCVLRMGPDARARHRALGMDDRLLPLYGEEWLELRYATALARPDVVRTANGWKFLEYNVSAAVGGPPFVHLFNRLWRHDDETSAGLDLGDPLGARAALIGRIVAEHGLGRRVALLARALDDRLPSSLYIDLQVDSLRAAGLEAEYIEMDDGDPAARLRTAGIRLAVQDLVPQDWADRGRDLEPLAEIRRAGVLVISPQSSYQVANKRVLAAASAGRPGMTARERADAAAFLPWTREVADVPVSYRGDRWPLPELLASRPSDFVLKRGDGNAGRDVVIGRVATAGVWHDTLQRALGAGTWIAQEYVEPEHQKVDVLDAADGSAPADAAVLYGPIMVDERMSGCFARFDLAHRGGMITLASPSVQMASAAERT